MALLLPILHHPYFPRPLPFFCNSLIGLNNEGKNVELALVFYMTLPTSSVPIELINLQTLQHFVNIIWNVIYYQKATIVNKSNWKKKLLNDSRNTCTTNINRTQQQIAEKQKQTSFLLALGLFLYLDVYDKSYNELRLTNSTLQKWSACWAL